MTTYKPSEWKRDDFGKFANKKRGVTKWEVAAMIALILVAAACFVLVLMHIVLDPVTYEAKKAATLVVPAVARAAETDNFSGKIDALKSDLVERLAKCESLGHADDYGLIVYDNNRAGTLSDRNIPSIGALQFKVTTVQKYEKMRSGKQLSGKDAIVEALDADQARALATYVIFETDGGINNWANCATQLGLPAEVKILKKLDN